MRENRTPGSVRGAPGNRRLYRDLRLRRPCLSCLLPFLPCLFLLLGFLLQQIHFTSPGRRVANGTGDSARRRRAKARRKDRARKAERQGKRDSRRCAPTPFPSTDVGRHVSAQRRGRVLMLASAPFLSSLKSPGARRPGEPRNHVSPGGERPALPERLLVSRACWSSDVQPASAGRRAGGREVSVRSGRSPRCPPPVPTPGAERPR